MTRPLLYSEEARTALEDFSKQDSKNVSHILLQILEVASQTGYTCYDWLLLKRLVAVKLDQVLADFRVKYPNGGSAAAITDEQYDEAHTRLFSCLDSFKGAPFTLQRLCELLLHPERHYNSIRKLLVALDKLLSVTSTIAKVDPGTLEPSLVSARGDEKAPEVPETETSHEKTDHGDTMDVDRPAAATGDDAVAPAGPGDPAADDASAMLTDAPPPSAPEPMAVVASPDADADASAASAVPEPDSERMAEEQGKADGAGQAVPNLTAA